MANFSDAEIADLHTKLAEAERRANFAEIGLREVAAALGYDGGANFEFMMLAIAHLKREKTLREEYKLEDIPLTEWRKREGGDDRFDSLHPGQMVLTIYRPDGTMFLQTGHPPDDRFPSFSAQEVLKSLNRM